MTVGSYIGKKQVHIGATECGNDSILVEGVTVSWNGSDNVIPPRGKIVDFFGKPTKFLSDGKYPARTTDMGKVQLMAARSGQNIFEHALERRFKAERPAILDKAGRPKTDYGTPNEYAKYWEGSRDNLVYYYASGKQAFVPGTRATCGFGGLQATQKWGPDDEYKLVSRLRKKVMGTDFNLASFLGAEGIDTVRFLGDTANRVYRAQKAIMRGSFSGAMDVLRSWRRMPSVKNEAALNRQLDTYRDLMDALLGRRKKGGAEVPWTSLSAHQWLEYHLAVEPLVGDCIAAAETLAHITQMERKFTVRSGVKRRDHRVPAVLYEPHWHVNRVDRNVRVTAYFAYEPEPLELLGLQDPEVTIWNAIPLSFVADYMYDIGGYLEAMSTLRALPEAVFVRSDKVEWTQKRLLFVANKAMVLDGDKLEVWEGSFHRSVSNTFPVPAPTFKPYGAAKSWQRMATVFSLLTAQTDVIFKYR